MSNKTNTEFGFFVGGAIIAVALIMGINSLVASALKGAPADMGDEAITARIAPVAQLNTGAAIEPEASAAPVVAATTEAAAGGSRSGEEVYTAKCAMCHATGAAGAPKLGDAGAWGPRIATGMDALMNSAINGKAAMPARGLCAACSDDELKAAVEHMVNNSK
ncbi:MAG: c-type cytochrome [Pseudomonadota bacterium]